MTMRFTLTLTVETGAGLSAEMIRGHPRYEKTAIIFISAIQVTDLDRIRGYKSGAVDYVPVPVIPEILRAKVRIFTELYRKNRQLEELAADLERLARRRGERGRIPQNVADLGGRGG